MRRAAHIGRTGRVFWRRFLTPSAAQACRDARNCANALWCCEAARRESSNGRCVLLSEAGLAQMCSLLRVSSHHGPMQMRHCCAVVHTSNGTCCCWEVDLLATAERTEVIANTYNVMHHNDPQTKETARANLGSFPSTAQAADCSVNDASRVGQNLETVRWCGWLLVERLASEKPANLV